MQIFNPSNFRFKTQNEKDFLHIPVRKLRRGESGRFTPNRFRLGRFAFGRFAPVRLLCLELRCGAA